jgi:hypothetical protein
MMFRLLFLSSVFSCFAFISAYSQVVTYGSHTKDSTFEKQIVDSLSMSTEFYLRCTPQKPIYQYNFVYSMAGRKSQEVGDNTKPQFLASTKTVNSIEFKPNSVNNYDCLLTCSPLSLSGSQITNIGTLKDSSFTVQAYEIKNGSFSLNTAGIINNFTDNFESVLSDPGITRIRSLFAEDIDRKFLRFVIPKYPLHTLEVGDEWSVSYKDSTKTITQPLIFDYNLFYKIVSFQNRNKQQIVTVEFKSNKNKIYQKNYPDTEFETTMEIDETISGIYEIDKSSGLPIKITLKSRVELVSKDFKQRVIDAKRMDQTYEYNLL